jgi:hypothetical protein
MCAHNHRDVPCGTIGLLSRFGHLAGWAVLYSIGVTVILAHLLEREVGGAGIVYVALCAHAGYLLDRVKFRDRDLDPADLMAEPGRHQYLRRHAAWIRSLMIIEWIAAMVTGAMISPFLGGLVLVGIAAGIGYAGWKPGKVSRLKDIAGLKAVLVSGAVTGLATATTFHGDLRPLAETPSLLWWIMGIGMIVFGDAVICDLDDEPSDDAFQTRSLPVLLGGRRAGIVGLSAMGLGSSVLLSDRSGLDIWLFCGMHVLTGTAILFAARKRRDWIDGRMLVVALISGGFT